MPKNSINNSNCSRCFRPMSQREQAENGTVCGHCREVELRSWQEVEFWDNKNTMPKGVV